MNMSNESVEHLQQAFAEADPAPSLLQVVKDHPTYENIEFPLVEHYVEAVKENPSRGQALASAPASAFARLDTLSTDINGELDRAVHFNADFDNEVKDYGPKNKFLFQSNKSLIHTLCFSGYLTSIVGARITLTLVPPLTKPM
jgi:hypothetical protein